MKRTLATIVFTDAVGFSERMSRNESGTLDLPGQDFDRIRKACARHGGEVIKSTGDGLLMYFSSVVGTVSSAAAVATGERATSLLPMNSDAVDGPTYAVDLAKIYARTGRAGDAVQLLERLLQTAGPLTANELGLDPAWDRIRSDPLFRIRTRNVKQTHKKGVSRNDNDYT